MKTEKISLIEIMPDNQLLLKLVSRGDESYQYIYREAAAVYWDKEKNGFKSSEAPKNWTYFQWFLHMKSLISSSMQIEIVIDDSTNWKNISEDLKAQILNSKKQCMLKPNSIIGILGGGQLGRMTALAAAQPYWQRQ